MSGSTSMRSLVRWLGGRPGVAAACGALLAQFLLHKAILGAPFAPYALGNRLIRWSPGPLATEAIERLGHQALPLIAWTIVACTVVLAALIGRRPAVALGLLAAALSMLAARIDPVPHMTRDAVASALLAGGTAWLIASVIMHPSSSERAVGAPIDGTRRRLLRTIAIGGGIIVLGGWAATRRLSDGMRERIGIGIVIAGEPTFDAIAELSMLITPVHDHYTVDINLANPVIDGGSWRLKIVGAAAPARAYSLADLRAMPAVEMPVLLQCISNEVGGDLAGNAIWTGVGLADLLADAGVDPRSAVAIARGTDGYHESIPLDAETLDRVLVAYGMDGELLPGDHGYPARLIFPGRYGMRHVKWLSEIEFADREHEGYWVERGWDSEAIMRTGSRMDVPRDGSRQQSPVQLAGVAWAGDREVSSVEVSTDGGVTWTPAQLEEALAGPLSWRRWRAEAALGAGCHTVLVRAYDGSGAIQDAETRPPHPSGATGYHRVSITVV